MIVTLTTDFGTADSYVAQMKGVILGMAESVQIVDITHEIAPHDIMAGAFVLAQAVDAFPRGSVHVAVVDPGVGGSREPIVVETEDYLLVGPNNGLLSLAAPVYLAAYRIENPLFRRARVSATFEGRDVFASAAARSASGLPAREAGPSVSELAAVKWQDPQGDEGEVIAVDRFGNLITNLRADHCDEARSICVGSLEAPLVRTFGDVPSGYPLAYVGSSGFVEVGLREGSAFARTSAGRGAQVKVIR